MADDISERGSRTRMRPISGSKARTILGCKIELRYRQS